MRHVWWHVKRGPTEVGYAYFRARRRRRGLEVELSESDQLALSGAFDIDPGDLEANRRLVSRQLEHGAGEVRSILWFLPYFHHVYFAGVHTILRFADHLAREHGVESRFCIFDATEPADGPRLGAKIAAAFPSLAGAEVTTWRRSPGGPFAHLRECDVAVATMWSSAYPVMAFRRARAKLYFVQDYEPAFYPAGSAYALAEETYRFGLPGIVNTPGLADVYRGYGNRAISFVPAVDAARFHPPARRDPDRPVRVLFYGRPGSPRNAFGLGLAALSKVKECLGDRVEIVSAGQEWDPKRYGVEGRIASLGLVGSLDEVAALYRSCDIGLVFMLTRHPSYQPFEWMASGMATVSNRNPYTSWLLRHEHNALVAPAAPTPVAEQIIRLAQDPSLRERITTTALEEVRRAAWSEQIDRIFAAIRTGEGLTAESDATTLV